MTIRPPIDARQLTKALVAAICLAVALTGSTTVAAGRCATAQVPNSMIMPDGSTHDAGKLRVCTDQDYSPVSSLHTVYVNGRQVGMFLSQRSETEGLSDREEPFFLFYRSRDGRLVFHAHAWPEDGRMQAYRLYDPRPARAEAHASWTWRLIGDEESVPRSEHMVFLGASRY
jgi:hypothetical protein